VNKYFSLPFIYPYHSDATMFSTCLFLNKIGS
jgi:hypothetical protein